MRDLIEAFNYLIGLHMLHISVPQTFQATFKGITDPDLPEDQHTKLVVDGRIRQDADGSWWFRRGEGRVPGDSANPNYVNGSNNPPNLKLDDENRKVRLIEEEFMKRLRYTEGMA